MNYKKTYQSWIVIKIKLKNWSLLGVLERYANFKMTTTKQIIIMTLTIFVASCSSGIDKKNFEHNYSKYWDKYTDQQLIDTLYSDTLNVGPDAEGGWTTREFYINMTKQLIADLQDDKNKIDSLYPMTPFDKLTIKKLPFGFKKSFTNEETRKFLEIINDPVSFDWAESTYEPEFQLDFFINNIVVASLTIGADKSIIKTNSDRLDFKKFKFGQLKGERQNDLTKLLMTLEND